VLDGPTVEITGYVPSDGMRESILAEARRTFPTEEIRVDLTLARGAPDAFGPAVALGAKFEGEEARDRAADPARGEDQHRDQDEQPEAVDEHGDPVGAPQEARLPRPRALELDEHLAPAVADTPSIHQLGPFALTG